LSFSPNQEAHRARQIAESFGSDPERYDQTRPRYPEAMVTRVVAHSPGPDVLDVGCGTGIAARQFQAAGCRVLGVEVDERMAEVRGLGSRRPKLRRRRLGHHLALGGPGPRSGPGSRGATA
jgi:2-polyprenyl-3-methyl-5-hydroxy-6-metoxy-1,4-benzoquinol methylase